MERVDPGERLVLERVARARLGLTPAAPVRFDARRLGGLETGVMLVTARGTDALARARVFTFVAKRLAPPRREAAVYTWLAASGLSHLAPERLDDSGAGARLLLLARLRAPSNWPWRSTEPTGWVLQALAGLHGAANPASFRHAVPAWTPDDVPATLQVIEQARRAVPAVRTAAGPAFRVAERLPEIAQQIAAVLPPAVLHGDAHPGNAQIVGHRNRYVKLLDWNRARIGSPLEDVASWLQSLAYWEPETRRRHDTLLRRYLEARGIASGPGPTLRNAYWLAAAVNAFGGALRYHLFRAMDASASTTVRERAAHAATDWLRILRRASRAL